MDFNIGDMVEVVYDGVNCSIAERNLAEAGLVGTIVQLGKLSCVVEFDFNELATIDPRVKDPLSDNKFGTWRCYEKFQNNVGRIINKKYLRLRDLPIIVPNIEYLSNLLGE